MATQIPLDVKVKLHAVCDSIHDFLKVRGSSDQAKDLFHVTKRTVEDLIGRLGDDLLRVADPRTHETIQHILSSHTNVEANLVNLLDYHQVPLQLENGGNGEYSKLLRYLKEQYPMVDQFNLFIDAINFDLRKIHVTRDSTAISIRSTIANLWDPAVDIMKGTLVSDVTQISEERTIPVKVGNIEMLQVNDNDKNIYACNINLSMNDVYVNGEKAGATPSVTNILRCLYDRESCSFKTDGHGLLDLKRSGDGFQVSAVQYLNKFREPHVMNIFVTLDRLAHLKACLMDTPSLLIAVGGYIQGYFPDVPYINESESRKSVRMMANEMRDVHQTIHEVYVYKGRMMLESIQENIASTKRLQAGLNEFVRNMRTAPIGNKDAWNLALAKVHQGIKTVLPNAEAVMHLPIAQHIVHVNAVLEALTSRKFTFEDVTSMADATEHQAANAAFAAAENLQHWENELLYMDESSNDEMQGGFGSEAMIAWHNAMMTWSSVVKTGANTEMTSRSQQQYTKNMLVIEGVRAGMSSLLLFLIHTLEQARHVFSNIIEANYMAMQESIEDIRKALVNPTTEVDVQHAQYTHDRFHSSVRIIEETCRYVEEPFTVAMTLHSMVNQVKVALSSVIAIGGNANANTSLDIQAIKGLLETSIIVPELIEDAMFERATRTLQQIDISSSLKLVLRQKANQAFVQSQINKFYEALDMVKDMSVFASFNTTSHLAKYIEDRVSIVADTLEASLALLQRNIEDAKEYIRGLSRQDLSLYGKEKPEVLLCNVAAVFNLPVYMLKTPNATEWEKVCFLSACNIDRLAYENVFENIMTSFLNDVILEGETYMLKDEDKLRGYMDVHLYAFMTSQVHRIQKRPLVHDYLDIVEFLRLKSLEDVETRRFVDEIQGIFTTMDNKVETIIHTDTRSSILVGGSPDFVEYITQMHSTNVSKLQEIMVQVFTNYMNAISQKTTYEMYLQEQLARSDIHTGIKIVFILGYVKDYLFDYTFANPEYFRSKYVASDSQHRGGSNRKIKHMTLLDYHRKYFKAYANLYYQ